MGGTVNMQVEQEFADIYRDCQPFTMADLVKCHNLYTATRYVVDHGVQGAFVECGVWRGGCSMLMARTVLARGVRGAGIRELYLYDTFAGMSRPTEEDVRWNGEAAAPKWEAHQTATHNRWCYASRDEVERNMRSTGYEADRVHLVEGPVEETIPGIVPDEIAILRLDTDFFASTDHELRHLYPRLVPGGVLILDDYHCWRGHRRAVDRYFAEMGIGMMLTYTSTSATGVKALPYAAPRDERGDPPATTTAAVGGPCSWCPPGAPTGHERMDKSDLRCREIWPEPGRGPGR